MARPQPPGGGTPWRIIPRPLLETILNNHAHHHRVPQPLLLHGPRGVGKSSLVDRLLPSWNSGPHHTAFVDLGQSQPAPWTPSPPSPLPPLRSLLESSLETLTLTAIRLGAVSSRNIFNVLTKYHSLRATLKPLAGTPVRAVRAPTTEARVWHRAVFMRAGKMGREGEGEEGEFVREAKAALEVAREVIGRQQAWRKNAVRWMNGREGRFSRSLVSSATDWPMLLVEVLSEAAEVEFFQV